MAEKEDKKPEKKETPKKETPKEGAPKKETTEKEGVKKGAQKKTAPKKETTKKKAPKKEAPKKKTTKKVVVKRKPEMVEKVNVYSIKGKAKKKIKLPKVFFEDVRSDLIRRAVSASRANRRQLYGPNPESGMSHAVSTWGKGRGVARVQRFSQGRTAAESPNVVGGRRAHGPKLVKDWSEKINRKERKKARNSALSATKDVDLITKRGHKFKKSVTMPIVVEDSIEKIKSVREAIATLEKLGVKADLERAKSGVHVRAGKGKMRGRRYRKPKSVLLVVKDYETVSKGFSNIPGVDITTPEHLSCELLAPGGMPGRLTIFAAGALAQLERW